MSSPGNLKYGCYLRKLGHYFCRMLIFSDISEVAGLRLNASSFGALKRQPEI